MNIYTRLFKESDFEKLEELMKLYDDLRYPTSKNDLKKRLTYIYNHADYYILLLIKNDEIILDNIRVVIGTGEKVGVK